jgi:nicotinate-nucleotide--dimethylbenzimidazole phosphoribosyltransferase
MLLGGVVALVVKPEVRNRLLDALFGPEEQFEYDSVTEPVAPPIVPDQRAGGEHVAAGAAATPDWQPPAEDSSHGYAEQEPEAPDGPLRAGAGDETPAPASEPWKAPAAVDAPEETPTVAYEPWSQSGEAVAAPEETPTVVHEPWSQSGEAVATPEETPTVVHEPWSQGGEAVAAPEEPGSQAPAAVDAPEETPTVAYEPWPSSGDAAAPQETPTVAYEPWSASGDAAAAPEEPGSPSEEAVAAPEEPWSPSGESAAAREDEPELIVYREAARLSSPEAEVGGEGTAWIEPSEDFEADLPEPSADSTLDHGELAGEDSNAAVAEGTADQAEADAEEQQQPAIGEAESPRSGWWMPRRRRPDGGTREPPRWD